MGLAWGNAGNHKNLFFVLGKKINDKFLKKCYLYHLIIIKLRRQAFGIFLAKLYLKIVCQATAWFVLEPAIKRQFPWLDHAESGLSL
jgi:hypothetical protein